MNKNISKPINRIDYLFVLVLVIYAGKATTFTRAIDYWDNVIGLLLPVVFSAYMAYRKRVSFFSKKFLYLIICYTIYFIATTIKYQTFHPRFFGIYLISFYAGYVALSGLKFRFFIYYEKILYYLCIIGVVFWGIEQVFLTQLTRILQLFAFSEPGAGNVLVNIIVYTISNLKENPDYIMHFGGIKLIRNAGFSWEPGGFAVMINLAMYINLIRTRFNIRKNKNILVFFIALLTTFSTTGYGIFMLLMIFYMFNQRIKYIAFIAPVVVILGIYITSLSFMTDKLKDVTQQSAEDEITSSVENNVALRPQRTASFLIDFQDFLQNPILGLGGHLEARLTRKLGAEIATISGIGKVFSVFGMVGVCFFFITLFRSSLMMSKVMNFKGWFVPFFMIIMVSISYSLIFNAVFMIFWMFAIFYPENKVKPSIVQVEKTIITKKKPIKNLTT
jgi:hypothetical protein